MVSLQFLHFVLPWKRVKSRNFSIRTFLSPNAMTDMSFVVWDVRYTYEVSKWALYTKDVITALQIFLMTFTVNPCDPWKNRYNSLWTFSLIYTKFILVHISNNFQWMNFMHSSFGSLWEETYVLNNVLHLWAGIFLLNI